MSQKNYDNHVLALSGLQNYWPLSETSGLVYKDKKAANDAEAAGVPARVTGPDGKGKAVNFAKTANSIGVPGAQITLPKRHSFFYWIKLNEQTAENALALEWATAAIATFVIHNIGYTELFEAKDMLFSAFYGGAGTSVEHEHRSDLPNGVWKFVTVNVDPAEGGEHELKVYINGVHTGTVVGAAHQVTTPGPGVLGIGGRGQEVRTQPLNGALQGVGLVNRPLTVEEMEQLFHAMTLEPEPEEESGTGSARAEGVGTGTTAPTVHGSGLEHIYWSRRQTDFSNPTFIGRAQLDRSEQEPEWLEKFDSFALAATGTHLFWAVGLDKVMRAALDGTGAVGLTLPGARECSESPNALVVSGSTLYFSTYVAVEKGAIVRVTGIDTEEPVETVLVTIPTFEEAPRSVAVSGEHLYWTVGENLAAPFGSGRPFIARSKLDGTGVEPEWLAITDQAWGLIVVGEHLYWTTPKWIGRAKINGTEVEPHWLETPRHVVDEPESEPQGGPLATDGTYLYWGEGEENDFRKEGEEFINAPYGYIGRVPLDKSKPPEHEWLEIGTRIWGLLVAVEPAGAITGQGSARAAGEGELQDAKLSVEGEGSAGAQGVGFLPHEEPPIPPELEELWKRGHRIEDKVPQYVGAAIPTQVVKIRLGRLSHYWQDNETPGETSDEEHSPMGCGHQPWDEANFPCLARVGLHGGDKANPHYDSPWQARFVGTTPWVEIPNVLEVKLDKKLEGLIAAVGQATVEIENILYPARPGPAGPLGAADFHGRERGAMAPLRGVLEAGNEFAPDVKTLVGIEEWLAELTEITEGFTTNEWEGRFSYAAQIQIYQGYGDATMKTFTGLIEGSDATSKPDRIVVTARDFGQVFTDTHFFGWGTDPVIRGPVVFNDRIGARNRAEVPSPKEVKNGQNAKASSHGAKHPPDQVLDYKYNSWWESLPNGSAESDEFIEIPIPEGVYTFADIRVHYAHMELYLSLKPSRLEGGTKDPTRRVRGKKAVDMTAGPSEGHKNKYIDAHGWIDPTREETQIVPGAGFSYMTHFADYPLGDQRTPFDHSSASPAEYRVGDNSILRITLRHLHKVGSGDYRAAVSEFHALREATKEDAVSRAEWVLTDDVADVIRILCQWAGFKEWDIPDTGAALPKQIMAWPNESYMDIIKKIAEGFNLIFFMADPTQDGPHGEGADSLGVPTMRRSRVIALDSDHERELREGVFSTEGGGIEAERGGTSAEFQFPNRGSKRSGLPRPVISDRMLLEAIDLQQKNEVLSSLIRIYGLTKSQPGDMQEGLDTGHFVNYTFRPPWAGVPADRYAHSQLAGIQKAVVIKNSLFATVSLCRNAAFWVALRQAIESVEATIQIPALPTLEIDDHATLMDAGTGIATRLTVLERSSVFKDGESRSYTMSITGTLIDVPNVRDMVNIINEITKPNGAGEEWSSPKEGTPSTLGYG